MTRLSLKRLILLAVALTPGFAQPNAAKNSLVALSGAIRRLTSQVAPTVVEITVTGYSTGDEDRGQTTNRISRQRSSGSGVLVDASGYIMTNAHVVKGAVSIKVLIPGATADAIPSLSGQRILEARIIGIDRESDLALLKVEASALPVLRFGDSDQLRQGDLVLAVGSPLGLQNSVSMGVISAPARAIGDENLILYIQTDASINPGDSGGALVDASGALIGLNSFIASQSGGNEGIGFAIPSNVVRNVYLQLRTKGHVSRGTIGLSVQDITPVLAQGLALPGSTGVVVADLEPDSPSEKAGLKRRDVIVTVNGLPVETARQFENDISRHHSGDKLTLGVRTSTGRSSITVTVDEQTAPWDALGALATPEKNLVPRLGILCVQIDDRLAQTLTDLRRKYGLIVAAKSPEGQAQFIDLQPGDVIHGVNNLPVATLDAFKEAIVGFKPGDPVVLQIERDDRFRFIAFVME